MALEGECGAMRASVKVEEMELFMRTDVGTYFGYVFQGAKTLGHTSFLAPKCPDDVSWYATLEWIDTIARAQLIVSFPAGANRPTLKLWFDPGDTTMGQWPMEGGEVVSRNLCGYEVCDPPLIPLGKQWLTFWFGQFLGAGSLGSHPLSVSPIGFPGAAVATPEWEFAETPGGGLKASKNYDVSFGGASEQTRFSLQIQFKTPEIRSFEPQYREVFLAEVSAANRFTAVVDWKDAPPEARSAVFNLNGVERAAQIQGDNAIITYDMGTDFQADANGGNNQLSVIARTASGSSAPATLSPKVVPVPPWAAPPSAFTASPGVSYVRETIGVPEPPFDAQIEIPAYIPYLGGQWGLSPTRARLGIKAASSGAPVSGLVSGETGFALGQLIAPVHLPLDGETHTTLTTGSTLRTDGHVHLHLPRISYDKTWPLIELIPGVQAFCDTPIIGEAACALLSSAVNGGVRAYVGAEFDLTAYFKGEAGALELTGGAGTGTLTATVSGWGDVLGFAGLYVVGGGSGSLTVSLPPARVSSSGSLSFAAYGHIAGMGGSIAGTQPWSWGAGAAMIRLAGPAPVSRTGLDPWQTPAIEYSLLVTNLPFDPAPALASGGSNEVALVWAGAPLAGAARGQIWLTLYDGTNWSAPGALNQGEAYAHHPTVAFDAGGRVLVAWEQNPGMAVPSDFSELPQFARGLEVAYALVEPVSGAIVWRGVLGRDNRFDVRPRLKAARDGSVRLVWHATGGTSLVGNANDPAELMTAVWDGTTWTQPVAAVTNLTGLLDWDFGARSAVEAFIALNLDTDQHLNTAEDREILQAHGTGQNWSAPVPVTSDNIEDWGAKAIYTDAGDPAIAWVREQQIVGVIGTNTFAIALDGASAPGVSFNAAQWGATARGLVLVWPGANDLYGAATLGSSSKEWTKPQVLLATPEFEQKPAVASAADGKFWLAAMQVAPPVNLGIPSTSAVFATRLEAIPPLRMEVAPSIESRFVAPGTIILETIMKTNSSIVRVDYWAGRFLFGSAFASPYQVNWPNVPEGEYQITAVAVDQKGASIASAQTRVTVTTQPVIRFNGASRLPGGQILLSLTSTGTNGIALQTTTNLFTWKTIRTIPTVTPNTTIEHMDSEPSQAAWFYRALLMP